MIDRGLAVLLMVTIVLCGACPVEPTTPRTSGQVATVVAVGANAALPVLISAYRQEGLAAIQKAPDRATAETQLAAIERSWAPIWKAWRVLAAADEALAGAIERGESATAEEAAVRAAFCELMKLWPESVPVKPIVPLVCT